MTTGNVLLFLALLIQPFAGGCTQFIRPPAHPANPTKVYVADYGLHSSIFLPVPSETGRYADDGLYVEYAFGDWAWMALDRTSPIVAMAAVFVSPKSALGRRVALIEAGRMPGSVKAAPASLTGFYVDAADVRRLSEGLQRRFDRGAAREVVWNATDETTYAADPERYWFARHCNHITVRWLRKLGCDVRGLFPTSHFKMSYPKANGKTPGTPRQEEKTNHAPLTSTDTHR